MKTIISQIIKTLIKWGSYMYSPSFAKKLSLRLDQLYTFWLTREFKALGKNAYISRPLYLIGGKYMEIGTDFYSLSRLRMECWDEYKGNKYEPSLIIGNNVIFNYNCHIGCINKIVIGNNVLFASNIFVTDHYHGEINGDAVKLAPSVRPLYSKGPVIIEDNVWVGEGVSILPNVKIGKNSIIGANSVVNNDVPANCVVGGIPAKILKKL